MRKIWGWKARGLGGLRLYSILGFRVGAPRQPRENKGTKPSEKEKRVLLGVCAWFPGAVRNALECVPPCQGRWASIGTLNPKSRVVPQKPRILECLESGPQKCLRLDLHLCKPKTRPNLFFCLKPTPWKLLWGLGRFRGFEIAVA